MLEGEPKGLTLGCSSRSNRLLLSEDIKGPPGDTDEQAIGTPPLIGQVVKFTVSRLGSKVTSAASLHGRRPDDCDSKNISGSDKL